MSENPGEFSRATGRELEDDSGKPRYLRYQRDLIRPHCGRRVVELGAGTGEFASEFTGFDRYVLTDVDANAVEYMGQRFAGRSEAETQILDLDGSNNALSGQVDTVLAINVLEHIEDDVDALRSMSKLTGSGGTIIMWVPAYQQLYGDFDRKVGHYRRYTPQTLRAAFDHAGLEVQRCEPKNLLGAFAWWAAVRKGGSGAPNRKLVSVYDRFVVPVTRSIENVAKVPFGQSVLGVAKVP
ncbi:class I SAM-dependent methyltransferase [Parasphingorhabdus pacifica]